MRKIIKLLASSLACPLLVSCASVEMSEYAKDLRERMTLRQAEGILAAYVRPSATRGGLCMIGEQTTTQLDYDAPMRVSEFVIGFSAAQHGKLAVDARDLREIRVLEASPQLTMRCRNYKAGHVVVLKPQKGLPDQVEVTVNASTQEELDRILAALLTLSPQARLTGGLGM